MSPSLQGLFKYSYIVNITPNQVHARFLTYMRRLPSTHLLSQPSMPLVTYLVLVEWNASETMQLVAGKKVLVVTTHYSSTPWMTNASILGLEVACTHLFFSFTLDGVKYLLKPKVVSLGPRWRIRWYVGLYQSRDETESLYRPDLYSSTRCIIPYINGSEPSSLYTCNTSWHSVYYMILNKPLVRLTTVHYQSTISMISFAQVLTAQWSNTIPCQNVQFQVRITSHNISFQHSH